MAMAEHFDTTILPSRSRKPRDKAKVGDAVLIVERWILARLRNRRNFSLSDLNAAISASLSVTWDMEALGFDYSEEGLQEQSV